MLYFLQKCGEDKTGKKYTGEVLGREVTYCQDCHDKIEEVKDDVNDLFK